MRTFDLAPLYRSTVGFDRLFSMLDQAAGDGRAGLSALQHRAHRRERLPHLGSRRRLRRERPLDRGEGKHADDQGEKQAQGRRDKGEVLYQGIAARAFERVFQLADYVQVKGAALENGLLHVDLVREIPEAKKPRQIPIGGRSSRRWSRPKLRKQGCLTHKTA